MKLVNLSIDRVIIHQIYQRTSDQMKVPDQSMEYTRFASNAMIDFEHRVIGALGEDSRAVVMEIVNQATDDLPEFIDRIIDQSDDDFVNSSYDIAVKLAKVQFSRSKSISGGIVVVFTGTQGYPAKKFLGIMKADIHSGYEKIIDKATKQISLKHIEELLLTPSSRLYKTIGFCEKSNYDPSSTDLNDKWSVLISDNQISQVDGKVAAQYFYENFAGCGYPKTSARTTKQFYDATKKFISQLNRSPEESSDFVNALNTFLKVNQSPTVNPLDFSANYFDLDIQDDFKSYLLEQGIPTNAFTKDLTHISNQLKTHKVTFSNNVKIEASPETFNKDIIIEPIDGDVDDSGNPQQWTRITVKSKMAKK